MSEECRQADPASEATLIIHRRAAVLGKGVHDVELVLERSADGRHGLMELRVVDRDYVALLGLVSFALGERPLVLVHGYALAELFETNATLRDLVVADVTAWADRVGG